jgi:hypothetical protein
MQDFPGQRRTFKEPAFPVDSVLRNVVIDAVGRLLISRVLFVAIDDEGVLGNKLPIHGNFNFHKRSSYIRRTSCEYHTS